ncbi:MAG TPA: glycosyltransferase family 4 protein [Syntrophomonadaceae bacterium]|nr:glycosyltransferase family 4 protein [Syntrophomonadaceae bacterium]HQD90327.1 glycosyltransferase family 4 protein [Syntrophomonadaceae bacterium]
MKILMFSWEYPPHMVGGLGQHVFDLSRFLASMGETVHIITPRVGTYPDYWIENGVHIHRVGSPAWEGENFKSWTFTFNSEAIREAVRLNGLVGGFDVVHAHDWLVAYAGRSLAKIFEIPLVSTIHATEHGRNLGLHNRMQMEINEIEKNLALESEMVICCSNYMQEEVSTLFGRPKEDVRVIPNGVDPDLFTTLPAQPRFNINADDKVVFFIGRLVPEKGVWQLIQCFPQVLEREPKAVLYIGGRGPQQAQLEKLARDLGVDARVTFTGFITKEDRNYVYNQARVAVFPSLYEPFGIVALEAMATHTPVIVGNVGGLAEIVENRVNGLKVTPGSVNELAQAIIELLTDTELANQLQETGYETVKSVYGWEVIARSTLDVYREVIYSKNRLLVDA